MLYIYCKLNHIADIIFELLTNANMKILQSIATNDYLET